MRNLAILACTFALATAAPSAKGNIILFEDFEDGSLDSRLSFSSVGGFSRAPGIKDETSLGSTKAFGFGSSVCGVSCFSSYATTLEIAFAQPTFVSSLTYREIERFGNWGSAGQIFVDGIAITGHPFYYPALGRLPSNDFKADTTFRERVIPVDLLASTIDIYVVDITNASEIFIDDLRVHSTAAVPVPAALPIIAVAFGGFGFAGWRQRRKPAPATV